MSDPLAECLAVKFDLGPGIASSISDTARAFIGDEIAARYKAAEDGYESANFEYGSGFLYGLDIAEQIARGEQP